MSVRAINWAWEQMHRCPGAPAKLTLVALADRADDDGRCWPWIKTLADKLDAHPDSVSRAIAQLEEAGLVERERRRRDDGSYSGWEFNLPLESHPAEMPDGSGQPPGSFPVSHTEELPGQDPTKGDVTTTSSGKDAEKPRGNPLVAFFVDESRRKGVTVPRSMIGQVATHVGKLQSEGFSDDVLQAAIALLIQRGTHPATLPSLVFQVQTAGAVRQAVSPERKVSPFARASQFVLSHGWQHTDDVLAEIIGRDYGIEGEAKERLLGMARNVRATRAAA